jgi:hypothetical protein
MVRFLHYDGSGYWLCSKRLSKGRFERLATSTGGLLEWRALELLKFLQLNYFEKKQKHCL